jgi:hypothetical protein
LRTIVPPIVDSACVFRDGRCEQVRKYTNARGTKFILVCRELREIGMDVLRYMRGLSPAIILIDRWYMAIATAQVESYWKERTKDGRYALTATFYVSDNARTAHCMLDILLTVGPGRARMKELLYYIMLCFVFDKAVVCFDQVSSHVQSVYYRRSGILLSTIKFTRQGIDLVLTWKLLLSCCSCDPAPSTLWCK